MVLQPKVQGTQYELIPKAGSKIKPTKIKKNKLPREEIQEKIANLGRFDAFSGFRKTFAEKDRPIVFVAGNHPMTSLDQAGVQRDQIHMDETPSSWLGACEPPEVWVGGSSGRRKARPDRIRIYGECRCIGRTRGLVRRPPNDNKRTKRPPRQGRPNHRLVDDPGPPFAWYRLRERRPPHPWIPGRPELFREDSHPPEGDRRAI